MAVTQSDKPKVPALRFPEFSGEWEKRRLGEVVDTVTSGSRDWAQYYSSSGAKFIRMTNIPRDGIHLLLADLKYVSLPSHGSEGERTSLHRGDILVSITAELGKIGLVPDDLGEAYINQHTALIRPSSQKVVSSFLAHSLSTKASNKRLNRMNDSGAKAGLNLGTVRSFSVSLPSAIEQQKIGDFLGAVDERLEGLRKKRDLLRDYKRGAMQKIFSQQIRFTRDDGTAFPDWEEKRLGEVLKVRYGKDHKGLSDGPVPVYGTGGIMRWVDRELYAKPSVLIGRKGTINVPMFVTQPFWTVDTLFYSEIAEGVEPFFAYLLVQNINWLKYNEATGVPSLNATTISRVKVQLPHPEEQQKIADFLSAIDEKIEAVENQITETEAFKKGLLQQMFV